MFNCIIRTPEYPETQRRKLVKMKFQNVNFLKGTEDKWVYSQLMAAAYLHSVMAENDTTEAFQLFLGIKSFPEFRRFFLDHGIVAALLSFVAAFVKHQKIPADLRPPRHRQWDAVCYHSIFAVALMVDLPVSRGGPWGANMRKKPVAEDMQVTRAIANEGVKGGLIEDLVSLARGCGGMAHVIAATWATRLFVKASSDGAAVLTKTVGGVDVFSTLFEPVGFSKMLVSRYDQKGYEVPLGERGCIPISLVGVLEFHPNPFAMSLETARGRLRKRAPALIENAGTVLASVAERIEGARMILNHKVCLKAMFRWMAIPMADEKFEQPCGVSAGMLLAALCKHASIATELADNHSLVSRLEPVLFTPIAWPLDDYLIAACNAISHGGGILREFSQSKQFMVALCACVEALPAHVQDPAMQTMEYLVTLPKSKQKVLAIVKSFFEHGLCFQSMLNMAEGIKIPAMVRIWNVLYTVAPNEMNRRHEEWRDGLHDYADIMQELMVKNTPVHEGLAIVKARALTHFKAGRYEDAIKGYHAGLLQSGPMSADASVLFSNIAECTLRMDRHRDTVLWATHAIVSSFKDSNTYVKSVYRRYKAFATLGLDFEALNDLTMCVRQEWCSDLEKRRLFYFGKRTVQYNTCASCEYAHYGGMHRCGRCQTITYCSQLCQASDWSTHKNTCQPAAGADPKTG